MFRVEYGGYQTEWLSYSISAADMTDALEGLAPLVTVAVTRAANVGSYAGFEWTIDIVATTGPLEMFFAEGRLLTGRGARATVSKGCPSSPNGAAGFSSEQGIQCENFVIRLSGPEEVDGIAYTKTASSGGEYWGRYETPRLGVYNLDVGLAERGGLKGEYFNNRWLHGEPTLTRIDSALNFYWPGYITDAGKDYVSVRWTGYVQPAFNESYTFVTQVNDGVKLWVGGELLVDEFEATVADASSTGYSSFNGTTSMELVAGRLYDIQIEYRENVGRAELRLLWQSNSQPQALVAPQRLFHASTPIYGSPFEVRPSGIVPYAP
jgi:hypothetical protein